MKSINNTLSLSLILLSASFVAFGSFARKYLLLADGIYITMLICFVGASILMWWIVSVSSFTDIKIIPTTWKPILMRVILLSSSQTFFFISLSKGSLLLTVLLYNTNPLFVPFIRFIFLRKNISYFNLICIGISFVGVYLILGVGTSSNVNIYVLCALFSGVFNAASQVILHKASEKEDPFIMTLWIYTLISLILLVLLPFIIIYSGVNDLVNISIQPIIIWIILAVILNVSVQVYRVKAYKYTADPSLVAPGMYFSVVVAAILDIVFYGASISFLEACGILMICACSILSIIKKSN
ncbi:DMT family transporter [Francisella sp. 19X1-34]|uniref:DMT family transporter n=1 Tax=Francisella sp. 19X1-34 TaxID=3087177 RepID=UPI002E353F63|nr:DMT family transporter [Francisella sp. 19X1-34]MED7788269.1 DMT family transporter [Francisella sp. 19X1-34]